jgi:Alginate export
MMCTDVASQCGAVSQLARRRRQLAGSVILSTCMSAAIADNDVGTALTGGDPALDLRYRFEYVDQNNVARDANASTLRLRLNYRTDAYRGFRGFVEFDYVGELLADNFNSGGGTSPGRSMYPVVADPHGSDLNQFYVDYEVAGQFLARAGRQRILLDKQRFVGGVGWRQNEQTFDGLSFRISAMPRVDVQFAHLVRVKRIFGERSPEGSHDADIQLLNAAIKLSQRWSVSPYVYLIDNDDAPALSTRTLGMRLTGAVTIADRELRLAADVASQRDNASAPVDYRAAYWRADASLAVTGALSIAAGFERLGGNSDAPGRSLRTPLATLHAFQGWADQFLTTPDAGIEDVFLGVDVKAGPWHIVATGHDFRAAAGARRWGKELDVSVGRSLGDRYSLLVKLAVFDSDDSALVDVRKFWLMLSASF